MYWNKCSKVFTFCLCFLTNQYESMPKKTARLSSVALCGGQTLNSASFNLDEFYFWTSFWDSTVPQVTLPSKNIPFKKVFNGAIDCWANYSLTKTALLLQISGIALMPHPTVQEHALFIRNCVRIKIKSHSKCAPEKWGGSGKQKAQEWDN